MTLSIRQSLMNKGINFTRNIGTALVGQQKSLVYQLSSKCKLYTVKKIQKLTS